MECQKVRAWTEKGPGCLFRVCLVKRTVATALAARAGKPAVGAYRNCSSRCKVKPDKAAPAQPLMRMRRAFDTHVAREADPSKYPDFRPGGLVKGPRNAGLDRPFPTEKDATTRHGFLTR